MRQAEIEATTVEALHARAMRLDESADRAFRRWFNGDVRSASGAASVRSKADEAWSDLRMHPDFDVEVHGELASYGCGR